MGDSCQESRLTFSVQAAQDRSMHASRQSVTRCEAVAVSCIDYPFIESLRQFLDAQVLTGTVDLIGWPGGAMALTTPDRDAVLDAIAFSYELHHPSSVVLVAHEDCDQLGGSACFAGPQAEIATLDTALTIAGEIVAKRFPTLRVQLVRLGRHARPVVVDIARVTSVAVTAHSK